jgi:ABC-type transport system involved in multi-copper enzyme maturation permease subunit
MLGPIFQRELLTLPRRARHYPLRVAYLGLLWVLALTAWQAVIGWDRTASLGDAARFNLLLFQLLTYAQLTLLLFFSVLVAASSITLEKDRRTFVLLLMTDLRNYEIVLGKLLSSLLQIFLFLAGAAGLLSLLLLLGGVAPSQVAQAVAVMAGACVAAGSLGCVVALWRDKTFQTLALTFLFLVLYLCIVQGLAVLPTLLGHETVTPAQAAAWQQWLDPFRAVQSILDAPDADAGPALAPAYGFALVMLGLSVLLNLLGVVKLRRWNPSGEPVMQRERPEDDGRDDKDRLRAHAAPGPVRRVWANPILWREIGTRAYGRRPLLVKLAYFLVLAMVCYYLVGPVLTGQRREWDAAWAVGVVGVLSLLLVSAQAVTAITTERDLGALDLLLVTDLTPNEFIFGKLLGILYNTKEYLLPPLILVVVYGVMGRLASPPTVNNNVEATSAVAIGALLLLAFAIVLGIHVALRAETSRLAILQALGTIFFLSVGTLVCIALIVIAGRFEYQWLSFVFFLAAGSVGLWWVLNGERPSGALTFASLLCPVAVFYSVTNVMIGRPGTNQSADPLLPFLVVSATFAFTMAGMLVPLLSEFDVALGRTSGGGD